MSNPIMNRLEKEFRSSGVATAPAERFQPGAPAAGPANPAAGPAPTAQPYGRPAGQPYGQPVSQPYAQPAAQPIYDQAAFAQAQQAYHSPAADAVQMGRMTYDDVIVRTGTCLAVLTAGAAASWFLTMSNPESAGIWMFGGLIVGLVLAMVNIFSKTIRPALIVAYSLAEGVMLGALSALTELWIPGVVIQAVLATVAVFGVTLALFTSGKVRNSPKMQKFVLISLLGIIVSRLLIWLFGSLGWLGASSGGYDVTLFGIPLTVIISLFAVVVGAMSLIGDFDQARVGVERGVPAKYAWMVAFGIMVTVVWLYTEILRLLSYFNSNN